MNVKNIIIKLVFILLFYSYSSSISFSKDIIKIGTLLPYSGVYTVLGEEITNAMSLAFEEVNNTVNGKNIALVSAPDSQLITIQPYDPSALEAIEKAISDSDIDINPNNDGTIIRLSIPPLTEERRKELVKLVHKVIEDGRIAIRNIRRDANDQLKSLEKSHSISEDTLKIELENIQDLTNEHIDKLNKMQENKEKEILE